MDIAEKKTCGVSIVIAGLRLRCELDSRHEERDHEVKYTTRAGYGPGNDVRATATIKWQ